MSHAEAQKGIVKRGAQPFVTFPPPPLHFITPLIMIYANDVDDVIDLENFDYQIQNTFYNEQAKATK